MNFEQKVESLGDKLDFLGGPKAGFEFIGKLQLMLLLHTGLKVNHRVLDFGCGALRGGYWLIHFLKPNCYFGIEGRKEMVQVGKDILLEDKTLDQKQPSFDYNIDFNFSIFDETFDYIIARSVWTHMPKSQIARSLDAFKESTDKDGLFVTSLYLTDNEHDYEGSVYKGTNKNKSTTDVTAHSPKSLLDMCQERELTINPIRERYFTVKKQTWLVISHD